jgi:5'(3')-deoxyribonucleotidase
MPLNVGIDLDGVVFDFARSLGRYLLSIGDHRAYPLLEKEPETWDFYNEIDMSLEEFLTACNDGADAGYVFAGPTRPGAVQAVNRIYDAGHRIHIITGRQFGTEPAVSKALTHAWLRQHGFKYNTVSFSADKTIVATDIFVEDKIQNYDALEAAGSRPYLVNRPWNIADDDRRRLHSVTDFADIVLETVYA